jgi:all-trans-retinol 13,14-reductase
LRADRVVSNAGAVNTFGRLLPDAERSKYGYDRKLKQVQPSSAHVCLYIGLKGTARELGIPRTNLWIYPSADHEGNVERYLKNPELDFPMLYISFPSAKDPSWEQHYPGKATVEVLTVGPYEWWQQWAGTTWNDRGADYQAKKEQLSQRLLKALYQQMPQLEGHVDFYELSTPLSTQWFQCNQRGEIYGLDHDPGRFRQDWLQATTEIKGLYLTGQDVVTAGVGGGLIAGMITSMAMLGGEAWKLRKLLKNWQAPEMTAEPVISGA